MLIPFDCATTLLPEVFKQWNFVADFQWFLVEISATNNKFGYLKPILRTLGVMHDLGWWLVWKPMVDFLFVLVELFSLSITVPLLRGKMCTAWLFWRGPPLCTHYLDRVVLLSTILGTRKLETLGYLTVKTEPLCIPLFWHNTGVWWTDGGICCSIYSACKASSVVHCKNRWHG